MEPPCSETALGSDGIHEDALSSTTGSRAEAQPDGDTSAGAQSAAAPSEESSVRRREVNRQFELFMFELAEFITGGGVAGGGGAPMGSDGPTIPHTLLTTFLGLIEVTANHRRLINSIFGVLRQPADSTGENNDAHAGGGAENAAAGAAGAAGTLADMDWAVLKELIDPDLPIAPCVTMKNLRAWYCAVNVFLLVAEGSEPRLRFRYLMLGPIALFTYKIPSLMPEFLPRCFDHIVAWEGRKTYDSKAMQYLFAAYRGEIRGVEQCLEHIGIEFASNFMSLRQEVLEATSTDGEWKGALVLPTYMSKLFNLWRTSPHLPSGSEQSEEHTEAARWYTESVGRKVLSPIEKLLDEEIGYQSALRKLETRNPAQFERVRGQVELLLRKELITKWELLKHEAQLMGMLDSRHSLLVRQLARASVILECITRRAEEEAEEQDTSGAAAALCV